jgi:hypothetical protein
VQAALGDVLAAAGKHGEALSHYSAALEAAQTVRPDLQAGFAASLKEKMGRLNALQAGRSGPVPDGLRLLLLWVRWR